MMYAVLIQPWPWLAASIALCFIAVWLLDAIGVLPQEEVMHATLEGRRASVKTTPVKGNLEC